MIKHLLLMLILFSSVFSQDNIRVKKLDSSVTILRLDYQLDSWTCFNQSNYRQIAAGLVERQALLKKDSLCQIKDSIQSGMILKYDTLVFDMKDTIVNKNVIITNSINRNNQLKQELLKQQKLTLIFLMIGLGVGLGVGGYAGATYF